MPRPYSTIIANLTPEEAPILLRSVLDAMPKDQALEVLREWALENDLDGEEL